MKHLIFSTLSILISFSALSQESFLERSPYFVGEKKIMMMIEQNTSKRNYKWIVYQKNDADIDSTTSVLMIKDSELVKYWLIKNNSILLSGNILNDSIFWYKNYLITGAKKIEQFDGFIPPVLCGINTENIIYKDAKKSFYFEYGDNVCSYIPNSKYDLYRKEWLRIIRNEIYRTSAPIL